VAALDSVNFEKPYTAELAGVSTDHKSTPPTLSGVLALLARIVCFLKKLSGVI